MSTSQNHKKSVTGARARATAKKKSKRNLVVFTVEIILLLLLLAIIVVIGRDVFNPKGSGPKVTVLDPGKLSIPEEIQQAKEEGVSNMTGYMNIALFGVDAVNEKQLYKNSRSDSLSQSSKKNHESASAASALARKPAMPETAEITIGRIFSKNCWIALDKFIC